MKNKLFGLLLLAFITGPLQSQENCSKYYPMKEGSFFEYTMYDKKGKTEGVTSYTISEVSTDGGATSATFDLTFTDKKGKEVYNSDYTIQCSGDGISIDYKSLFPAQMMKQYEDMGLEMDISGTDIQLPNDLSVGKELDDANISVAMKMSGMKMNISVDQTNRKVEKKESITTPAGTFECYVITETASSTTMGATRETVNKLWLAEGVGMIKQESYKQNGSLLNQMELTSLKQ
ncbi:MAG: hypothetical protein Mars2KO_45380 [Maribacter sp.]